LDEGKINSAEWAAYLGHGVKAKDVHHAMYDLDRGTDSLLLLNNLYAGRKLSDSLRKNTFLDYLVSGKNNNALGYYRFSKKMQSYTSALDRWSPVEKDSLLLIQSAAEALKRANNINDRFLKLRYYYQSQRYYHYAYRYKDAALVYDKHIAGTHSNSHVAYWAQSLRAGEAFHMGDAEKGAYMFSKVFELAPERR